MIKTEETAESIKYGGLSNSEIMIVYYRFKKYMDDLEEGLSKNQISKTVNTPMGKGTAIMQVPDEHIQKFKATEYYKLSKAVVAKLGPIVELLQECDDNFKQLADELR
jgi:hypothetical protein